MLLLSGDYSSFLLGSIYHVHFYFLIDALKILLDVVDGSQKGDGVVLGILWYLDIKYFS
jgi:hypothetical protein